MKLKQLINVILPAIKLAVVDCFKFKYLIYLFNDKAKIVDAWHCTYGTFIDYLYWNDKSLLSELTILQLEFRHKVMNQTCLDNGSCIKCGCTTTALQAATKSCEGKCYPEWINEFKFRYLYCYKVDGKLFLKDNKITEQIKINSKNELATKSR